MRTILGMILFLTAVLPAMAQQERKYIREGNSLFGKQDYEKAEVEYRKAADKKAGSFEAAFNMADALYKQKKYDEALQQFSALAKQETDKRRLGEIYHNIGNTLLAMQKTDESIEAYKESLRNRPDSEETKYNLEFARHQQQQQQQQDQNKEQNKDQNQDQQNQDQQNQDQQNQDQQDKDQQDQQNQNQQNQDQQNKDQQNKDQQNNNQQNQDQQNRDQQEQQPQEGKISKEDAERLLEALQKDEKQVQDKVRKQKVQEQKAKKMKIEKDW